jgi:TonB family protein
VTDAPAAASTWKFDNPFCEVLASLVPAHDVAPGSEYGVQLFARHGATVAAHVTLIGADSAYDAHVAATNLQGAADDRRSSGVIVKLEKPERIHYFFVDSYSIDGGAPVTCPSYVFLSGSGPSDDGVSVTDPKTVAAGFLQKLPDLPCGNAYIEPTIQKGFDPIVGVYGGGKRSTMVHVFIDSNGSPIRATMKTSSGLDGIDDAALAGVQRTRFHPAQFLCTPVVGEVDMEMDYSP